ncbi:GH25 family lysozyme [Marinactinospora rubrisoli]|uniref:GH25 family lysozyme n=1 Tax=Marinactinospora rubrisoli TaxID=2715399 RepID=A0ABW2KCD7_9ACTN
MRRPLARIASAALAVAAVLAPAPALADPARPADARQMAMHAQESSPAELATRAAPAGVPGIDVSHWQGGIDWGAVAASGVRFAYIKATQRTNYRDPNFNANYVNAYNAGIIRGAYHFAEPNRSSGADQANYFAGNGGAWSADGRTLPGALDLEDTAGQPHCYGMTPAQIVAWTRDFSDTYRARTGRDVVIYTSRGWWDDCAGGSNAFAATNPLWVASWTTAPSPTMPSGFGVHTFWQYTSTGSVPGIGGNVDRNVFNGSEARLIALANNTP